MPMKPDKSYLNVIKSNSKTVCRDFKSEMKKLDLRNAHSIKDPIKLNRLKIEKCLSDRKEQDDF